VALGARRCTILTTACWLFIEFRILLKLLEEAMTVGHQGFGGFLCGAQSPHGGSVPNPKLRSLNGAVIWVQLHALLRSHSFALVANNFTRKTIYSQMASFCGPNFIVIKYLPIGSVQEQMCTCFDNIQHR
jgi:hypothetical protein